MSADLLTISVGIAGVLVSLVCAMLGFRLGARQADRQTAELLAETRRQNDGTVAATTREVRGGFSSIFQEISRAVQGPSRNATTTEMLVRASLASLLDERGEVNLGRLLGEVSAAKKSPSQTETFAVLHQLREQGLIDWPASSNLATATFVRVRSPGERTHRGSRSDRRKASPA
jgi:hypothetical protein